MINKLVPCLTLFAVSLLAGCTGVPEGIEPVENFELERYLGTWYEIARLDHSFERGLSNVTATYSLRDDGGVTVVNRGYDEAKGEWDEATGKAYFIDDPDVGRLKVSFFGPFYGGYNVFLLDEEDYGYAAITGPNRSYLWLLARKPALAPERLDELVNKIGANGFPTEALIYIEHDRAAPRS